MQVRQRCEQGPVKVGHGIGSLDRSQGSSVPPHIRAEIILGSLRVVLVEYPVNEFSYELLVRCDRGLVCHCGSSTLSFGLACHLKLCLRLNAAKALEFGPAPDPVEREPDPVSAGRRLRGSAEAEDACRVAARRHPGTRRVRKGRSELIVEEDARVADEQSGVLEMSAVVG